MNTSAETDVFYGLGIMLAFVEITIMLLAVLRLSLSDNKANGKTRDGGIVVIVSAPIVFAIEQGISEKDSVAGTQPHSSLHNHNCNSLLCGAKISRNLKGIFKEDVDACSGSEGNGAQKLGLDFIGSLVALTGALLLVVTTALSNCDGSSGFDGIVIYRSLVPIVIDSEGDALLLVHLISI